MEQLIIGNAMQQYIFGKEGAINIWKCSNKIKKCSSKI